MPNPPLLFHSIPPMPHERPSHPPMDEDAFPPELDPPPPDPLTPPDPQEQPGLPPRPIIH